MPDLKTVHLENFIDLNKESLNLKLTSHLSLQEPVEACWAREDSQWSQGSHSNESIVVIKDMWTSLVGKG